MRGKNKKEPTQNNSHRNGYCQNNADRLPSYYVNHQANDSLVRKPAVKNKKNRTIKTERPLIAEQECKGLLLCSEVESRSSSFLRPLDDTVTTTYALAGLNLAGVSFPLSPYSAPQAAGFFPAENRHKKLSRVTADKRTNLDGIDEVAGAEGVAWRSTP